MCLAICFTTVWVWHLILRINNTEINIMKEKIIEILKAKTMMLGDESGNGYLDSDEFNEVSTQIVKLFDIPYVSNRRELLAYHKWYLKNRSTVSNSEPKYMVEIYLRQ